MLALLTLIGGLRGILVGIAGAGAMFALVTAYHATFVHPSLVRAAVAEGARVERVRWEAEMKIVRDRMEVERIRAQSEIDQIERKLLEQTRRAGAAVAALNREIEEMEGQGRSIAIPKKIARSLDKIGR